MNRRLFTILSALSLLLFVAVVVLWVRSYWVCDRVSHGSGVLPEGPGGRVRDRMVWSDRGLLAFFHTEVYSIFDGSLSRLPKGWQWQRGGSDATADWMHQETTAGFKFFSSRTALTGSDYFEKAGFTCPHGVVVLLLAALPAWWVIAYVRRRRRSVAGVCALCGYDLRATPQRCPECGTASAASV